MKKNMLILLFAAITFLISACTPTYITVRLPMPMKPDLPQVTNKDLECVSNESYSRIAGRDYAHTMYEKRLEAVIKSTWRVD